MDAYEALRRLVWRINSSAAFPGKEAVGESTVGRGNQPGVEIDPDRREIRRRFSQSRHKRKLSEI